MGGWNIDPRSLLKYRQDVSNLQTDAVQRAKDEYALQELKAYQPLNSATREIQMRMIEDLQSRMGTPEGRRAGMKLGDIELPAIDPNQALMDETYGKILRGEDTGFKLGKKGLESATPGGGALDEKLQWNLFREAAIYAKMNEGTGKDPNTLFEEGYQKALQRRMGIDRGQVPAQQAAPSLKDIAAQWIEGMRQKYAQQQPQRATLTQSAPSKKTETPPQEKKRASNPTQPLLTTDEYIERLVTM